MKASSYIIVAISIHGLLIAAAPTQELFCQVESSARKECGWPGITKQQCEKKGCCYDSKIPKSLWCFRKVGQTQDEGFSESEMQGLIFQTCSVKPQDKIDCGWRGITQDICESRGCCYSEEQKRSYWCFKAKTVFVQPVTEHLMQCTAECSGMSWANTAKLGVACKTEFDCWKKNGGVMGVICMLKCKNNDEIIGFAKNVSQCLSISNKTRQETIKTCDYDLDCWVEKHGKSAKTCFKLYSYYLTGVSPPLPDKGVIARQPDPEIQMPRIPYSELLEPNFSDDMKWSFKRDPNTSVTDIDIEKQSGVYPVEDITDEEESEPNPWWLRMG